MHLMLGCYLAFRKLSGRAMFTRLCIYLSIISQTIRKTLDQGRGFLVYIFSGADTPIRRNAFAIVWRAAVIKARRASVCGRLSAFNTLSAL